MCNKCLYGAFCKECYVLLYLYTRTCNETSETCVSLIGVVLAHMPTCQKCPVVAATALPLACTSIRCYNSGLLETIPSRVPFLENSLDAYRNEGSSWRASLNVLDQ